jgi:hypothetical protein
VVEEKVNFKRPMSVGDVSADDDTVPASNLPPPQEEAEHPGTLQQAALTFNPSPPLEEAIEYSIEAPDNQAELMHWNFVLDTLHSRSSNNFPAMVRSLRDWSMSVLPDVQATCLAQ